VLNGERHFPTSLSPWKRRENTIGGSPYVSQALPGRCDEDKNFRSRRKTNTGSPDFQPIAQSENGLISPAIIQLCNIFIGNLLIVIKSVNNG